MHYQLADLFEALCDANPEADALHAGAISLSRAQLDARANRLAHYLLSVGVRVGDHVGIYSYNRAEWVEALLACWKIRATAVNINFRYVKDELRYMWENADMVALIYEKSFLPLVDELRSEFPSIQNYLWLEDQSSGAPPLDIPYEEALASQESTRGFAERSEDDIFLIYTGGTTGMPKGVMWRHFDFYHNVVCVNTPTTSPESILQHACLPNPLRSLTLSPLMHGGGQFAVILTLLGGGVASIPVSRNFSPSEILQIIQSQRIVMLNIIGDAMAKPLAETQIRENHDVSSLAIIASGGAILTAASRELLKEAFGTKVYLTGGIGGSEIGAAAIESHEGARTTGPRFSPTAMMAVLDDNLDIIPAGSQREGLMAMRGFIPIGYYKDPVKTDEVFKVDRSGQRWVMAGDRARVEDDGSFTLLGRDSLCINSGGEKIYVEEVERAIALHPFVRFCAVVGVPDEKWQQRVVALVELEAEKSISLLELQEHCRKHIAGYKLPRQIFITSVPRTPNGKINYTLAQQFATHSAQAIA
jgi:acyl-CoA synthetase (AMP-forming)/AMP-acid ligase II